MMAWSDLPRVDRPLATCKSCGAQIRWQATSSGKMTPIDESGQPHWATCPQADDWRRK